MDTGDARIEIGGDGWWWVEWPIDEDWVAAERVALSAAGRLVAIELRIFPRRLRGTTHRPVDTLWSGPKPGAWDANPLMRPPTIGITARLLRLVKSRRAAAVLEIHEKALERPRTSLSELAGTTIPRTGGARRPADRGDAFYAELARDYVALAAHFQQPVKELAKRRRIDISAAKRYVYRARSRGLLTRSADQHGRAGGTLTEKARRLLARAVDHTAPSKNK